jgi:tryptophan 2,3-dioxygenase
MTDTPASMTYGDYLGLDRILSAQRPISDHHDEMLFIVIHQTKELWLKQIIHELQLALQLVRADRLVPVHKILSRVSRIQAVMTLSWDVLSTLTPAFRLVEYLLGLKDAAHLRHQPGDSEWHHALSDALHRPSLWDEANAAIARAGFALPPEVLERDWSKAYRPNEAVEAAWADVYRDTERWWPLYQLAEKLVDIDDAMATWRHKHVLTVERIIGLKRGTGGTAGVAYLQSTVGKRSFPELWSLRTRV